MTTNTESQPLVGTVNKYGSSVSSPFTEEERESSLERNKYSIFYGIVSIATFLLFLSYAKQESINNNGSIHWHTSLPAAHTCPAICGVGYIHSEEMTPLTSVTGRRLLNSNDFTSYSAKYANDIEASTIEVARVVPRQDDNSDDFWLISQKLDRCEVETPCTHEVIDFVDDSYISQEWQYMEDSHLLDPITIKFAIKQGNSDYNTLENELLKVSDPNAINYGKYWSYQEIHDFFKPSNEAHEAIKSWLKSFGVLENDCEFLTPNGDFLQVKMNVQQANDLLSTKFGTWKHQETGRTHEAVEIGGYNVPSHVSEHLDFVSPTLRFPMTKHMTSFEPLPETAGWITDLDGKNEQFVDLSKYIEVSVSDNEMTQNDNYFLKKDSPTRILLKRKDESVDDDGIPESKDDYHVLSNSDGTSDSVYNTPARLLQLYSMHEQIGQSSDNSQAVASFLQEWYNMDDVEMFDDYFDVPDSEISNVPDSQPSGYGTEAELDVQYMTATGRGIHTYVWDIEDSTYFISMLQQLENADTRPLVVSMSYGGDEQSNGETYCSRANVEFAKVGLLGVTFFASAGDNGACGTQGSCGLTGEYLPSFPASSPFVTAVGGTYGGVPNSDNKNDDITESESESEGSFSMDDYNSYCDRSTSEIAWYNSGGGFSKFFGVPSWQSDVISAYFSSYQFSNENIDSDKSKLETWRFNTEGRGYPDISGQSVNYVICDESLFWLVSGTSAATPSVAGMFAMINDYRLRNGAPSLGFLNPYLYSLYSQNMKSISKSEYFTVKNIENLNNYKKNDFNKNLANFDVRIESDKKSDKLTLIGGKDDMNAVLGGNNDRYNENNENVIKDEEDETIYQVSRNIYFNDVISGYTQGCGESRKAFAAIDGWDPATGLGTLKFGKLLEQLDGSGNNNNNNK